MTLHLILKNFLSENEMFSVEFFKTVLDFFIIGVTIVVVAVPEGLPLAVTIALAYSVSRMKDENNLVKCLQSCETMGGADNICSDKTGTLTKNQMTVMKIFLQQKSHDNTVKPSELKEEVLALFCEGYAFN